MAGLSREKRADQVRWAADYFARTLDINRTRAAIRKQYGCSKKVADRIVRELKDAWRAERKLIDLEARRDEYRAGAQAVYRVAMSQRRVVHNADGTPARYPKGHPREGHLVTTESPDLRRALGALGFLARLDGAFQDKVEVEHSAAQSLSEALRKLPDSVPDFAPGRIIDVTPESPTANELPAE